MEAMGWEDVLRRQAMSGDIGESSSMEVRIVIIVVLGIWIDVKPEVVSDGSLLVPRPTEVVAEAAGASLPCDLRHDAFIIKLAYNTLEAQ